MLVAHIADTHLGIRPYGLSWAFEAFLENFRKAFEEALREHVDAIILAGDLFDKPRALNRAIKTVMDAVSQAVDKGVKVYSVLGEHDLPKTAGEIPSHLLIREMKYFPSRNPVPDCFTLDNTEYCIGGINHYPLKYGESMKKRLLGEIKRTVSAMHGKSILILHQNISQFNMFEPGLDLNELPTKPRYIAMGHIHRRIIHRFDDGRILAYPGSLDIVKRDEINEWKENGKGFYLVDLSGDEARIERIDLEPIPQALVKTSLQDLHANIVKALKELPRDRESILHVEVSMKITERTDVHAIIRNIIRQHGGGKIYYRVQKKYIDEAVRIDPAETETIDEVEVVAELLGGNKYRDLAAKIVELKKALLLEDEQLVNKIIDEISSHPYWHIEAKIPQLLVKPPSDTGETKETVTHTIRKPGKKRGDLLSFLK